MLIKPNIQLSPTFDRHYWMRERPTKIVVHRLKIGDSIADSVLAFTGGDHELASSFGCKFPYHFGVDVDGSVTQVLPLDRCGVHARRWNRETIAIACFGDFRREQPPYEQWTAAAKLCRVLEHIKLGTDVWGHDELKEGSLDPTKQCPGEYWPIAEFLGAVRHIPISGADIVDFERIVA